MPSVAEAFKLGKTQLELDFVDVQLQSDNRLFIDPLAVAQRPDPWSFEANRSVISFFQTIVDLIRDNNEAEAQGLLLNLREPNETRLGYSKKKPKGAGIGHGQAKQIYDALQSSTAVRTGFISSIEESELLIEGISADKISDLTTNIIRSHLIEYTTAQCDLHGMPYSSVPMPAHFDASTLEWRSEYASLPVWKGKPILLVPKGVVRFKPAYQHRKYYQHYVLNYLQQDELNRKTSLVRVLRSGERRVYKKDVSKKFPNSKKFLYEFSRKNPAILKKYQQELARLEATDRHADVDQEDEKAIAAVLSASLKKVRPGRDDAKLYEDLMAGVLEFLFYPFLTTPIKQVPIHTGRKIIDIVMGNCARSGVFFHLPNVRKLPCPYVVFECKNYETEIGNPEVDQLSGRLAPNRGRVGFLCHRKTRDRAALNARCRDTFRDERGLIMPLDDRAFVEFLSLVAKGRRADLNGQLEALVAEVWMA